MSDVLDVSRDEDGEITQFLVLDDSGVPDPKVPSPENLLLYDPEDKLPFDGGMNEFLSGESALQIRDDPEILVSQVGDEYSYILSVGGNPVETTPEQAQTLLEALYDALTDENFTELERLYDRIISSQVRRGLVNVLAQTFSERERISIDESGWLVDGYYLVDWNANMYYADEDPEEDDYVRQAGGGVKKDTTYEIIRLNKTMDVEPTEVRVGGERVRLTEREMLFLSKITWLLNRRHYHPDQPFWKFVDQWADVDVETGKPDMDGERDLGSFNL